MSVGAYTSKWMALTDTFSRDESSTYHRVLDLVISMTKQLKSRTGTHINNVAYRHSMA